jgi:hypothetical protein
MGPPEGQRRLPLPFYVLVDRPVVKSKGAGSGEYQRDEREPEGELEWCGTRRPISALIIPVSKTDFKI